MHSVVFIKNPLTRKFPTLFDGNVSWRCCWSWIENLRIIHNGEWESIQTTEFPRSERRNTQIEKNWQRRQRCPKRSRTLRNNIVPRLSASIDNAVNKDRNLNATSEPAKHAIPVKSRPLCFTGARIIIGICALTLENKDFWKLLWSGGIINNAWNRKVKSGIIEIVWNAKERRSWTCTSAANIFCGDLR